MNPITALASWRGIRKAVTASPPEAVPISTALMMDSEIQPAPSRTEKEP